MFLGKYVHNISVDLIYGLPKSNISTWAHNLDILTSFNPPHISSYALTVEPKTVLFRQVDKGDIKLLDEEAVQLQYDLLTSRLEKEAYINYEFSNFGKIGFHSVNNSNYLEKHLKSTILSIEERSNVELLAIGIGHNVGQYYSKAITIHDVEELGGIMFDKIETLFT